ncbi:hypothetical protein [Hominiventricola aquisgranensis]|uniref:Uncharacterized protein n=1 Tax=Hominiventricola aquisgranensis TaxID=3133164 RepID=A0ABV1HZK3_9FIRM
MSRNKEEQARMEGMAQALRIAKAKGIDGLEADLKMRNITGLPCAVSRAAMDECIMNIKYNVIDTFTILVAYTLHEKFGFGKTRLNRFIHDFNFQAECLDEDYCTWEDQIEILRQECGLDLSIRKNDKDVRVR